MNRLLLDVNVLIALIDPSHEQHDAAHQWFFGDPDRPWSTCPTTENGVIRIVSNPRYPNPRPVWVVMESLESLTRQADHERMVEDVTLLSDDIDRKALLSSGQITDSYLALLAYSHGSALATFDRKLSVAALPEGVSVVQIPG